MFFDYLSERLNFLLGNLDMVGPFCVHDESEKRNNANTNKGN